MSPPLRILFAGSGEFGLPALAALASQHKVVHVYTQPDRPAGRGRRLAPTAVALWAHAHRLGLTRTADLNREALPPADVLVVIAFGQKIGDAISRAPRLGAINLHASLLPRYRGAAPIHHALIAREPTVGNSVIRLARMMDAGAILGQSRREVQDAQTTGELHDLLAADGAPLLLRVIEELAAGTAVEREQQHAQATRAPKLTRGDAVIDFARPAADVAARINGLSPWPGCHVQLWEGPTKVDEVTLLRARALDSPVTAHVQPGEVTPSGLVACGGGTLLESLELQPHGRRRMDLSAYRNGHAWRGGMRLKSF